MAIDSNEALIARSKRGDSAAYETLIRRHYRSAYVVALAIMGTREDAEDVCHDALVRVAGHLHQCRDPARFLGWLRAVVRNHARNVLVHRQVRATTTLDGLDPASPIRASDHAEARDLSSRLEAALGALGPAQREVVLLHDMDGMTHGEIAEVVGTSEGMCRQHLFHARRRLREILGSRFNEEYFK